MNYTIVDSLQAMKCARETLDYALDKNVCGGTIRNVGNVASILQRAVEMNEYHARQLFALLSAEDKVEYLACYSDSEAVTK